MGLLRRILGSGSSAATRAARSAVLIEGYDDLYVVGESHYQEALRALVGGGRDHVRVPIQATLVAEPNNQYDANAISVWVAGHLVGYLSRDDAQTLRPGLLAFERQRDVSVALAGVIVGGGEGTPSLGVFLNFDAAAFGLPASGRTAPRPAAREPQIRTGLSNAVANDAANYDYDLGWQSGMPEDMLKAIAYLRGRLAIETEPVSRHFMFMSLGEHLYAARDQFGSALGEFDEVCRSHDAEMGTIRPALIKTFGGLPLLEVYKQAAIRHQKAHEWTTALWWTQRGIEVYGNDAINAEVVEDLTRRSQNYAAKLAPAPPRAVRAPGAPPVALAVIETLACRSCGQSFERQRTRGRKPTECPNCRGAA